MISLDVSSARESDFEKGGVKTEFGGKMKLIWMQYFLQGREREKEREGGRERERWGMGERVGEGWKFQNVKIELNGNDARGGERFDWTVSILF